MAYTTIKKPSDYFDTKLYTGNGSTQSITGVGFQPDWVWIKNRSSVTNHEVADVVRGANKLLKTNATDAEQSISTKITSFDSDGFGIGSDANVNGSGNSLVAWNWLAGGTGVSNTDGTITSTVSANTTSGFSIVSYTGNATAGATVGHGLGVAPSMIILKKTSASGTDWFVYHKSIGATHYLGLNQTYDKQDQILAWNDTAPTSSVFSLGSGGSSNGNGDTFIAYCFSEVKGFSKFGSYVGNGSADGTFVYTGFKPAWVMIKNTTTVGKHWVMHDNKRNTFNPTNKELVAQGSGQEVDDTRFDFLSNGLKIRDSASYVNTSGDTYIYMAFAEEPLVGDNPATAR